MGFFSKKKPKPLMTAKEAAKYLRVSLFTLHEIEKSGALRPYRTPGGHRKYDLPMLNTYLYSTQVDGEEGEDEAATGT